MALEVAKIALFVLVGSLAFAATLVHSQDQSGFVSIDCGIPKNGNYTDEKTSLYYVSDEGFVETGISMLVSDTSQTINPTKQLLNVRSFPEGIKNCYTLRLAQGKGTNYLIRATFMYGNYDSKSKPPEFDLHLGADVWDRVKLENSSHIVVKEMIYIPPEDYLYVCLANVYLGTPFISTLEVRSLNNTMYSNSLFYMVSLELVHRLSASSVINGEIRYKDDIFDRIWVGGDLPIRNWYLTFSDIDSSFNSFKLPSPAMEAVITTESKNDPLVITFSTNSSNTNYYIFLHFAELQKLSANETREFNVTVDDFLLDGYYSPSYLLSETTFGSYLSKGSKLSITLVATARSTLPPIVNAMEFFMEKQLSRALTNQQDVNAVMKIKSTYSLLETWQGDPCIPKSYMWKGVNCSFIDRVSPLITTLNLSSSGLTGNIADSFSSLASLQVLDLSNNSLTGDIPESLGGLSYLTILNLADNQLTGSVPRSLLGKSEKGQLTLSTSGNPGLCSTCAKKKKSIITLAVAAIGALVGLVAVIGVAFLIMRRKAVDYRKFNPSAAQQTNLTPQPAYTKNKGGLAGFSYSEVQAMTKDFQKQLGKGGFGAVYYGCLEDGTEVAVKKLYASANGLDEFETEVELLMAIRHKNLVSLVGYCDEGENLVLIYEYMASGDLQHILSAEDTPTWKQRLQIAIDASQGLDYLHNGCRPPIVHRDVKTPNILLNENLQAKVADFGLSKIFPDENKSYVSTRVIGTPGYIDPGYYATQQLNEKTDVYSFGVVLLELITGQPAVIRTETTNVILVNKVADMVETGDVWNIVNERVNESIHNQNSLWRAIDLAMTCVKNSPTGRPIMSHIVMELKECLAMEVDAKSQGNSSTITTTTYASVPMTAMAPMAR